MLTKTNSMGASEILNDELETAIDKTSLGELLGAISAICSEKADHVRSNWGDRGLARAWDKMADRIGKLADKCEL